MEKWLTRHGTEVPPEQNNKIYFLLIIPKLSLLNLNQGPPRTNSCTFEYKQQQKNNNNYG